MDGYIHTPGHIDSILRIGNVPVLILGKALRVIGVDRNVLQNIIVSSLEQNLLPIGVDPVHLPDNHADLRPGDGLIRQKDGLPILLASRNDSQLIQGGQISVVHIREGRALRGWLHPQGPGRQLRHQDTGHGLVQVADLLPGEIALRHRVVRITAGPVISGRGKIPAARRFQHHNQSCAGGQGIIGPEQSVSIAVNHPPAVQHRHIVIVPVVLLDVGKRTHISAWYVQAVRRGRRQSRLHTNRHHQSKRRSTAANPFPLHIAPNTSIHLKSLKSHEFTVTRLL